MIEGRHYYNCSFFWYVDKISIIHGSPFFLNLMHLSIRKSVESCYLCCLFVYFFAFKVTRAHLRCTNPHVSVNFLLSKSIKFLYSKIPIARNLELLNLLLTHLLPGNAPLEHCNLTRPRPLDSSHYVFFSVGGSGDRDCTL